MADAGLQLLSAGAEPVLQRQQGAQLGAEGRIYRRRMGAFRNGRCQRLAVQQLQPGQGLLIFLLIEGVGHIVKGADGDDALAQSHLLLEGVPLPDHLQQLLRAGGGSGPAGQVVIAGLKGLGVGTGIGDIGKFPIRLHAA